MKKIFDKETMDARFENTFGDEDEVITEFELRIKEEFGNEKVKIKYSVCIPCIEQPHRIYIDIIACSKETNEKLFREDLYQFDKNFMDYLDELLIILDYITESKSVETEHIKFKNLGTETNFNSLVFKIKTIFEYLDLDDVVFS